MYLPGMRSLLIPRVSLTFPMLVCPFESFRINEPRLMIHSVSNAVGITHILEILHVFNMVDAISLKYSR